MTLDWLFGPRISEDPRVAVPEKTSFIFRPVVLDAEDIVDFATFARALLVNAGATDPSIAYITKRGDLTAEQLLALGPVDRERVEIHVSAERSESSNNLSYRVIITLDREGSNLVVNAETQHGLATSSQQERIATELVDWLLRAGRLRVRWDLLAWTLPLFPVVAMVIAYVWAASIGLSAPAHVFALATILAITASSIWAARAIYLHAAESVPGTRIRVEPRAETYRRRADHRRDWRVAILSIAGTLVIIAIGWLVTGQWR